MAPGRPAIHPEQAGLVIFSLAAIASGIYAAVRLVFG